VRGGKRALGRSMQEERALDDSGSFNEGPRCELDFFEEEGVVAV